MLSMDWDDDIISKDNGNNIHFFNKTKGTNGFAMRTAEWLAVYKDDPLYRSRDTIRGRVLTMRLFENGHELVRSLDVSGDSRGFHNHMIDYVEKHLEEQAYVNSEEFALLEFNSQVLEKKLDEPLQVN